MLDLKYIRDNADEVSKRLKDKGESGDLSQILELDKRRRSQLQEVEQLKHERKVLSEEVNRLKRAGEDASSVIDKTREISKQAKELDEAVKQISDTLQTELDKLPNLPHASVPIGPNETHNVEVKRWGDIPEFDFKVADHIEIGDRLDLFNFEWGSKISGRGFPVYKGAGAKLERAFINFMLDTHTKDHGYTELFPPFVVNRQSAYGTAQLPKLEDDMYHAALDDLFLIPTAEVPVTNIHRGDILAMDDLPINYCAYSACFRREAGSWGKDTRGFLRLHQFNKVEMVKVVTPETSYDEHEAMLKNATRILELLEVPYRVLELCSGDLTFAAAKCYDIEVWSPAEQKWLEASSCSNFEDFQARRMNLRFRRDAKSKPEFPHTLNGSGLATSRLIVSFLENNQQEDGSVRVPKALQSYFGSDRITRPL